MLKDYNIVCIGASDWKGPWGVLQQLMERFALNNRVLFIEYQFNFLNHFYSPKLFVEKSTIRKNLKEVSKNIFVFTPQYIIPFNYYFRFINKINQNILSQQINRLTALLVFDKYILWSAVPSTIDLVKGLKNVALFVYHCASDIDVEKIDRFRKGKTLMLEKEVIKNADIIFSHTEEILERYRSINSNIFYLASGVDYGYFRKIAENQIEEPKDIRVINKPRIGIVGHFDDYIYDIELLEGIVRRKSNHSFIFIGPLSKRSKKIETLKRFKNIYFIGYKNPKELPFYLKSVDVCLIPYRTVGAAVTTSPLKCYEYLASGKPVVSSTIKDILKYENVVKISKNLDEFCNNIDLAILDDSKENLKERLEIAKRNSWQNRVEMVSNIIFPKLANKETLSY